MLNNISKYSIDLFSANGKEFFKLKLPELCLKNENNFFNISSPFRRDRNPSFHISRNPSTNKWYYHDWGDSTMSGDVYSFAAAIYSLSLEKDFPQILERMFSDLKLDKVDNQIFNEYVKDTPPIVSYEYGQELLRQEIEEGHKSYGRGHFYSSKSSKGSQTTLKNISSKKEEDLNDKERQFLKSTGISFKAMKNNNSFFIDSYTYYSNKGECINYRPDNAVWLAYRCAKGCKMYQVTPEKKFWWVGEKPEEYIFGSDGIVDSNIEDVTFLAAGEKDVLTLVSRGYNALCLNSETANISRGTLKHWFKSGVKIVVLYDNDETGVVQAKRFKEKYHFDYLVLPNENGVKDITDYFMSGATTDSFEKLFFNQIKEQNNSKSNVNAIEERKMLRSANQRLEDGRIAAPIIPYLDVLFQTNELSIFFGDTGIGKSLFAVGLADAISKGNSFIGLENKNEPANVAYIDFELTDRQFHDRYTNRDGILYPFSSNFFIDNIDLSELSVDSEKHFENELINRIEQIVDDVSAKVLIVDNITFLSLGPAEDSKVALNLIRPLLELKKKKGISILALAHTPKKFGVGGLNIADVAGSKLITNFVDGVFAIGKSKKDKDLRYIKQIKSRGGEMKYDASNVIVLEIDKVNEMLTMSNRGFEEERQHIFLQEDSDERKKEMEDNAKDLRKEGKTIRQIAREIGVSKSTVGRMLKPKGE